jgi:hypothetical protein
MPFSNVAITLRVMSPGEDTSRTNHGQISNSFPRWSKRWLATVVAECSSRRSEKATLCCDLQFVRNFAVTVATGQDRVTISAVTNQFMQVV